MVKKQVISKDVKEIKDAIKSKKLVIGTGRTIKLLKNNKLAKVYLSANCPASVKEDIENYCKMNKVNVVKLKQKNSELGTLCKKPFFISVLGVLID